MRVVKAILGALVAAALIVMWTERDHVIDAYRNDGRVATEIQLDGVDLTFELSPIGPSPYEVVASPDTRRVAIADVFATEVALAGAAHEPGTGEGDDSPDGGSPRPIAPPAAEVEPPPIYGGTAQLTGVVTGPDGPVSSATIRLERHTSQGTVTKDIVSDAAGRWTAARLLGGRYRVWSWAAHDDLAMRGSQVFFLDEGSNRPTDLSLEEIQTDPRVELIDGGPIYVGLGGTVAISITRQEVDTDGRVVVVGLPETVVAFEPSGGVTAAPPAAVTDADGVARFTVRCQTAGQPSVTVRHSADVREAPTDPERLHPFSLPACIPLPPPPTTEPPPPADGATGGQAADGSTAGSPTTTRPSPPTSAGGANSRGSTDG